MAGTRKVHKNRKVQDFGSISGVYFWKIKQKAGYRGLVFNLTINYLDSIFDGKCKLSGVDIICGNPYRDSPSASLDRIDSSEGYFEGNVQWVHKTINFMKRNIDEETFIWFCEKVGKNIPRRNKMTDEELDSKETKTEEEALETTVDKDGVQYEIVDGDLDGVKVRGVRANGNLLFTVSEAFTNEQIQEVFNLANKFFNDGLNFGAGQTAARYLQFHEQMKALVPQPTQAAAAEEGSAEPDTE